MRRKGTPSVIRRGGTLQGDCPEHPACSSPSGGGCREATGEGEKCKASASRHFQPPVMIRASPSSAPLCALGHLPPLGEGRRRRGARGPHSASASREIGGCHLPRARGKLLPGGPSPSLCDTAPRRGERQAVRDRDSPCAGETRAALMTQLNYLSLMSTSIIFSYTV